MSTGTPATTGDARPTYRNHGRYETMDAFRPLVGTSRGARCRTARRGGGRRPPQPHRAGQSLAQHPLAVVRAHAVWAVFRIGGGAALAAARAAETDPLVLAEYAAEESREEAD